MLAKEARKIVKKYEGRLGPQLSASLREQSARLDTLLAQKDWAELELACEALDEELHQKASFARKGALRETLENVGIAVLVALGLRSCFYEPFKIPSPSMVPTLVPGDHIFVNKFRYGIQIPFTTTVIGEDMISGIERGEVVVFRYPKDESQDYIKRVIGLPGDTVRVEGDAVAIKRKGQSEFEYLERKKLDRPCPDDYDLNATIEDCVLFEETLDDRTYVIRIRLSAQSATRGRTRTLTVPEDGLLVMGDNRRDSEDSLQWFINRSAVYADGVVTNKDLRDFTDERVFEKVGEERHHSDPDRDVVEYIAERSSPRYDIALELWREPSLGVEALYAEAARGAEGATLASLLEAGDSLTGPGARKRISGTSGRVDALAYRQSEDAYDLAFRLDESGVVGHLRCGLEICATTGELASRVASVVEAIEVDPERPARELLSRPTGYRFVPKWSGRDGGEGRFVDTVFRRSGSENSPKKTVRFRAWREPGEGAAFVEGAAKQALGLRTLESPASFETAHAKVQFVATEYGYAAVGRVGDEALVFALECGGAHCTNEAGLKKLLEDLEPQLQAAAADASVLSRVFGRDLLGSGDGWTRAKPIAPELYEWDRVTMPARVRDTAYSLRVDVQHVPKAELETAMAARAEALGAAQADPKTGGLGQSGPQGHIRVFQDAETEAIVELVCSPQLCHEPGIVDGLAERAREKLRDANNFVDPDHRVEVPFVPRGNVKGRAERIWFPFNRFWTKLD